MAERTLPRLPADEHAAVISPQTCRHRRGGHLDYQFSMSLVDATMRKRMLSCSGISQQSCAASPGRTQSRRVRATPRQPSRPAAAAA